MRVALIPTPLRRYLMKAAWRAYQGRKAFLRLRNAAGRIQAATKGWYVRKQIQDQRSRQQLEQRFEAALDRHREKMRVLEMEKRALLVLPGSEVEEYEQRRVMAAVKVQAHWRGLVARRKMAQSPERRRREQAARRIQAAFRNARGARGSSSAAPLMTSAAATAAAPAAATSGNETSRGGRRSPSWLRQSGTSVLLGSPQVQGSPATPRGGGGSGGEAVVASPPQRQGQGQRAGLSTGGAEAGGSSAAGGDVHPARDASVMGPRRYKELHAQVEGKLSAYLALARTRGSRRPDPRVADTRLSQLLREYHRSAPDRLAATAERHRSLVVLDTLCAQLDQAVQEALLAEDEERWEALDARWRRKWREVEQLENQRADAVEVLRGETGAGAAAVAAARQAAAMQSKQDEYAARIARAAVAVPVGSQAQNPGSGPSAGPGAAERTT
ncbi:hypothetical protein VOLCADRAFT_96187 [Volvox carteri f. nagariensis]|uniref:Uncharacterized protein n=1 Tax=Volvox carteri f. nagariensis TaxID=3068 RepID=D8U9G0_VOLCA|nr:uncharacterized protein VOLCADRAFT_96187 [Volvox carteri f. nagariensis]EFJ43579.1 hypothetical protein VOLCADRAFT_96187 [Volvox carteri f. nagariensis]|eukprot:XP_002955279.1 hypothetical protein VOLCADRAFT_96187 [Volvox carteri f. nagariensis]